mmetsp:Transcript_22656/g.38756  ORF Transcript_22656/g.38756 Transcript_22656/m.38756 type:complete len:199 (-) Transcript_22656:520-1116(-)
MVRRRLMVERVKVVRVKMVKPKWSKMKGKMRNQKQKMQWQMKAMVQRQRRRSSPKTGPKIAQRTWRSRVKECAIAVCHAFWMGSASGDHLVTKSVHLDHWPRYGKYGPMNGHFMAFCARAGRNWFANRGHYAHVSNQTPIRPKCFLQNGPLTQVSYLEHQDGPTCEDLSVLTGRLKHLEFRVIHDNPGKGQPVQQHLT